MSQDPITVALLGLGVVGSGVAQALLEKRDELAREFGRPLSIARILEKELEKPRPHNVSRDMLTDDFGEIIDDPTVAIVVEMLGGETAALQFIEESIRRGKHVVTANKEVIAKHGARLRALAQQHNVNLLYEASVGGGLPIIRPFQRDLVANRVASVYGIVNGTTNYILTRMANEGIDFQVALREAQRLGYAEADPTNDIEGIDSTYKLAILASIAFNTDVKPGDVYREGISRLAARDFRYAQELGYAIKLLAIAKEERGELEVRVHPTFLPKDLLLAKVDDVYNAIVVNGDLTGQLLFYGRGAGARPTSSAIIADIVDVAHGINQGGVTRPALRLDCGMAVRSVAEIRTRYYIRMEVKDKPGVLAQIAAVLGDNEISIASVIQKEVNESAQTAEIVIMTHLAREASMQKALERMREMDSVGEIGNFVRVEN